MVVVSNLPSRRSEGGGAGWTACHATPEAAAIVRSTGEVAGRRNPKRTRQPIAPFSCLLAELPAQTHSSRPQRGDHSQLGRASLKGFLWSPFFSPSPAPITASNVPAVAANCCAGGVFGSVTESFCSEGPI
jgi:hypothetical protein